MRCVKLADKIGKTVRGKMGRYKIVRSLSKKGGMGIVFVAETTSKPKTEVVIKFAQQDPDKKERLVREAEFLLDFQKTNPKNIVSYVDESEKGADEFFLVMEKLEGQDLDEKIGTEKLDEKTVRKFSKDIAEALLYIHTCEDVDPPFLIHRDLKPDNIVVVKQNGEEQCILIDFGGGKKGFDLKKPKSGVWTVGWSCPHNALNPSRVGSDCDIYALGRVMFYMATGLRPVDYDIVDGPRLGNMQYKAEHLAGVSSELSTLIDDMIDYPNHGKVQTATDVIQRLNSLGPSAYQRQRVQIYRYFVHLI